MLMPPATQRAHFDPPWRGDRPKAIYAVARQPVGRDGIRAIDMNFQIGQTVAWNLHWRTPARNNYWFILEHGAHHARLMTRAERNRDLSKWRDVDIARWRRTRSIISTRPHSYTELVRIAVRHGVVICAELKDPRFASDFAARTLVNAAQKAGHPAWYMSLINMRNCRGKCEAIGRAGGEFAVIFGRFRRLARTPPPDWAQWSPKPARLWGPAKWPLR